MIGTSGLDLQHHACVYYGAVVREGRRVLPCGGSDLLTTHGLAPFTAYIVYFGRGMMWCTINPACMHQVIPAAAAAAVAQYTSRGDIDEIYCVHLPCRTLSQKIRSMSLNFIKSCLHVNQNVGVGALCLPWSLLFSTI